MKDQYIQFINDQNKEGSNKATSYIRAIDLLMPILHAKSKFFGDCANIWSIQSVKQISELYLYVIEQQKFFKYDQGIFAGQKPISYWRDGFCSAALKSYREFLILYTHEQDMWDVCDTPTPPEQISAKLDKVKINSIEELVADKDIDFSTREGKEAIREVKARVNQNFFRKMILKSYNTQCCITGLNIPEVLRASHIVGWAEDKKNRLNPANGLCLSATYDAAFDRHLISFDEDYRMVLSPSLKESYSNQAFKEQFKALEGREIILPNRFQPDLILLEKHRNKTFA